MPAKYRENAGVQINCGFRKCSDHRLAKLVWVHLFQGAKAERKDLTFHFGIQLLTTHS